MNARQKAKKYKRDLEFYKKTLPKYEIHSTDRKVSVLTVEEHYPMELVECLPESQIINDLVNIFAGSNKFRNALHICKRYDSQTDNMIFKAELGVVMPDALILAIGKIINGKAVITKSIELGGNNETIK